MQKFLLKQRNQFGIIFAALALFVLGKDNLITAQAAEPSATVLATAFLDGDYGYQDLARRSKGEARQEFYRMLEAEADTFAAGTRELDSILICEIDVTDLGLSEKELVETYYAVLYDNPQYYWMSNTFTYGGVDGRISVPLCTFEEYTTYASRSRCNSMITEKMQEYDAAVAGKQTYYDIALAIHDKLIEDVEYAYQEDGVTASDAVSAHNIIGVVDESISEVVCEGYTKMYQLLLNRYGIPNLVVTGVGNGEAHAWNLVQMDDGNYYYTDVTWDDTVIKADTMGGEISSYVHYNMPAAEFGLSHVAFSADGSNLYYLHTLPKVGEGYAYTFYAKQNGLLDENIIYNSSVKGFCFLPLPKL